MLKGKFKEIQRKFSNASHAANDSSGRKNGDTTRTAAHNHHNNTEVGEEKRTAVREFMEAHGISLPAMYVLLFNISLQVEEEMEKEKRIAVKELMEKHGLSMLEMYQVHFSMTLETHSRHARELSTSCDSLPDLNEDETSKTHLHPPAYPPPPVPQVEENEEEGEGRGEGESSQTLDRTASGRRRHRLSTTRGSRLYKNKRGENLESSNTQEEGTNQTEDKTEEVSSETTDGGVSSLSSALDNQPLYQWYTRDRALRMTRRMRLSTVSKTSSNPDEYNEPLNEDDEPIYDDAEPAPEPTEEQTERTKAPTAYCMLWGQMPEVISGGYLENLDSQERKIQEAMFEVITSEASYLRSLKVLRDVFMSSEELSGDKEDILTRRDRHEVFSNVLSVMACSQAFLEDLEARWKECPLMADICDIVAKHAEENFQPYVIYCKNQEFQNRALERLKARPAFCKVRSKLEARPECQKLMLTSFLLLPMQRVTRLPLLLDSVLKYAPDGSDRFQSAAIALDRMQKVAKACNEESRKLMQTAEICEIANQTEFKIRSCALISASRYLVKRGELIYFSSDRRKSFGGGKFTSKQPLQVYLFSDLLLLTKKRSNGGMLAVDYCLRSALSSCAVHDSSIVSELLPSIPQACTFPLLLTMAQNHDNVKHCMVFACKSESERERWLLVLRSLAPEGYEDENIYEDVDQPQAVCIRRYGGKEFDELSLELADVVNVVKDCKDGWQLGERLRDGERGWYPSQHVELIQSEDVKERNLQQRYRLMMASKNFSGASTSNL